MSMSQTGGAPDPGDARPDLPADLSGDQRGDLRDFLRERLARGNDCLGAGNARGALRWYDSALTAFADSGHLPDLRALWRAVWHNKAIAHQQLAEAVPAEDAMQHAQALRPL